MYKHKHNLNKYENNTLLSKHFLQKDHTGFDDIIIQIIDYLDPTKDNSTLDMLEDLHIKKLVTLYPFRLNDQIPISKNIVKVHLWTLPYIYVFITQILYLEHHSNLKI